MAKGEICARSQESEFIVVEALALSNLDLGPNGRVVKGHCFADSPEHQLSLLGAFEFVEAGVGGRSRESELVGRARFPGGPDT